MADALEYEQQLDGSVTVPLAPARGPDLRRNLPSQFFPRKPRRFLAKFWLAMLIIGGCWVVIAASWSWLATIPAMILVGLMYAHMAELEHECSHEHAFNSRRLNRIYGVVCGLFILSSYSYYKYDHLRHHASLGKSTNREFYNYRFRNLDNLPGFLRATFRLGRFVEVIEDLGRALGGRPFPSVNTERDRKRIANEYRLFPVLIVAALAFSLVTGSTLFLLAWLLPLLFVAEPAHFLVELPEHFGLNTQANPDVLANTRTIEASRLGAWYTNFNNLHTAHHYHQGVPMPNVATLDDLVRDHYEAVEPSYLSFYVKVLRGEIRYDNPDVESCMTR